MTKAFLKKCWIALSSACILGTVVTLACSDPWGTEYGTSNFTPEVFVANAYSPFFYSIQFYYSIGHDEAQFTRWNQTNATSWAAWLGNHPSPQELNYLLDTADTKTIDEAAAWMDRHRNILPQQLAALKLMSNRSDKKLAAFLHYLTLAKKAEAFSLTPIRQPWDNDSTKKAPFDATNLDKRLQQGLTTATDPFLQERYWFQLIRSHFFNGTPEQTIQLFEDYRSKFPANKLWYRSLSYMAGAWYKRKEYSKANYYYSRVFDSCDELKTVTHYSFHPQEQTDWDATLALCRNNEEKATLWQMLGIFYSDPNRAIDEIYRLDPHSEKLEILLSRAVNAAEQGFDTNDDLGTLPTYDARQTYELVTRIANAGNTAKPWVWQLAAGYLAMLNEQYAMATSWYRKAEATVPHESVPQKQFRLLKMLNIIDAADTIDHPLEQKLLPDIQWLIEDQKSGDIRNYTALQWLKKTFAAKYKTAGDKVKAECFVHESAFYKDNQNAEALKAFLAKPNKTPYEQLCMQLCEIKLPDIYAYQAALLSITDHLDEALTAIAHVPNAAKDTLPGNPFNARINDCHDCDHQAPQKIKYTKLFFLQKLKELKDKIAAGNDVYTNAILLGNAQYNCTHFGNARAFYEGVILGTGDGTPETIDSVFRASLTDMSSAIKYYTLAATAARNDEQRAKCQYLLAKCQRNQWYMNDFTNVYDSWNYEGPAFTAFDGFKGLKKYPNTSYYKEVIRECGYFKTYIRKNP